MSAPIPEWTVGAITPTVKFAPGTGPTEGFDVSFTTRSGVTASVFVPTAQVHDQAAIAHAIDTRARQLNAIQGMQG